MTVEPPVTTRAPLAGFGRRAAATVLDAALLFVAYILIAALLISLGTPAALAAGLLYLMPLIYYPVGWSRLSEGQTFGKRAFDIEVVQRNGEFISPWRAIGRFLAANLSAIPLGLGFWWAIWDTEHQTWHDKIAGTWVRRVDYAPRVSAAAIPTPSTAPEAQRSACPRCGESVAVTARVCRFCSLELGEHWAG